MVGKLVLMSIWEEGHSLVGFARARLAAATDLVVGRPLTAVWGRERVQCVREGMSFSLLTVACDLEDLWGFPLLVAAIVGFWRARLTDAGRAGLGEGHRCVRKGARNPLVVAVWSPANQSAEWRFRRASRLCMGGDARFRRRWCG